MTNAPSTRKTHVIRICGTNRNGDVLQDIWADVERIDVSKSVTSDDNYQGFERRYRWMDDPNSDDYEPDGNPARVTELVKVCDPQSTEDFSDPEEWIPIRRIKSMKMTTTSGDNNYQGRQDSHKNENDDVENTSRIVERRRIYHYDTSIDDAAQAAFDGDPSLNAYVVPGEQYELLGTKDDGQYVEHEIPMYIKQRGASSSGSTNMSPVDDQGKQFKLLNEYLIDESEPATLEKVGNGNVDPPYRLDPFQYIVNVNFSRRVIVVFVDINPNRVSSTFIFDEHKTKFLKNFTIHTVNPGLVDAVCAAFIVNANAGEFITTVMPPPDGIPFGGSISFSGNNFSTLVFAMDGDEDSSLNRAMEGTQAAMAESFHYFVDGAEYTVFPHTLAPDGLLWFVVMGAVPGSYNIVWKIRYGNHRTDNNSSPPNKMVQCYPITTIPWSVPSFDHLYDKYTLISYRLDKKGIGQVYGAGNPDFIGPSFEAANALPVSSDPPPPFSDNILPGY